MNRLSRKRIIVISIISLIFLLLFFLSAIVKNYVVKNSKELIGRKLEINELNFNYTKLAARIKGLKLYEQNGIDKFVSFDELYVNISPWKLISGEYSVSQIYLDGLQLSIIQDSTGFNFDDLLNNDQEVRDSAQVNQEEKNLKFSVYNIELKNGNIAYFDKEKDNLLDLNEINLALPLIAWDNQKSEMGVNFSLGNEGNVSIQADVNHEQERYQIDLGINSVDIKPFTAYVKEFIHISDMNGKFTTSLKINGSLNNFMDVLIKGNAAIEKFAMTDLEGNKFLGAKSTLVELDSINLGTSHYGIGTVELFNPEIYTSLYKESTNIERILAPVMTVDSLETETDTIIEEEVKLFYSVDSVVLEGGLVQFADKTLNRDFVYDIAEIDLNVGEITSNSTYVPITYAMDMNGGGKTAGNLNFNLQNNFDFKLNLKVSNLELMSFSPYTEFYIARPITQGTLSYDCKIDMKPNNLDNQNSVKISEFDFGKKTKDPNTIKAPVRLALYLLKDQNDNIQFDLPVSGNPNEPDFKLGKIIWKTLMNFFVKTAAKPFGILGNITGTNPEDIEIINLDYLSIDLNDKEKSTLKNISKILEKKPELIFSFTQETDIEKERTYLALENCAKDFYQQSSITLPKQNCKQLINWAKENVEFKKYLTKDSTDLNKTVEQLSLNMLGHFKANQLLDSVINHRNKFVANYLKDSLHVQEANFRVKTSDLRNLSEQQKEPKYRVEVSIK